MLGILSLALMGGYPSAYGTAGYSRVITPDPMDRFENRASLSVGGYMNYVTGTFYSRNEDESEEEAFAIATAGVVYTPSDWWEVYTMMRFTEWWPGGGDEGIGGVGDADIGLKVKFLDYGMLSMGLLGAVTLPTGENQPTPMVVGTDTLAIFNITDSSYIFGGNLLAEVDFSERNTIAAFRLCMNAGYYSGGSAPLRLGAAFVVSSRFLDYIVEANYAGSTDLNDPVTITPLLRFRPFEGIGFHAAVGVHLNSWYYVPRQQYEWNYDIVGGVGLITPIFRTVELKPGGSLMGKVYDSRTKNPVPAKVRVVEAKMELTADSNGVFNIKHLPAGLYTLVAEYEGYRKTYQIVKIRKGDAKALEIPMDPAALPVKVVVIDSVTLQPIEGVKVTFSGPETKEITSAKEAVEAKLAPGGYWLVAQKEGYYPKYMDLTIYDPKFVRILLARPITREPKLIETVYFDLASATLSKDAQAKLDQIAKIMLTDPTAKIVLVGHADRQGTAFYNDLLSEKRAKAVRDYLIKRYDIEEDRIVLDWQSEFQRKKTNKASRRVEIYLLQTVQPTEAKEAKEGKEGEQKDKKE